MKTVPVCTAVLLCLATAAGPLYAGSGARTALPATKPKNGLKLIVDTRWVDGNGYRPVRVTAINWPPGPTTADRTIRVVLTALSYQWRRQVVQRVTQTIEIPEGAAQAEATVSVPQENSSQMILEVYEDGRRLEDLFGIPLPVNWQQWTEASPAILIIDADAPTPNDRESLVQQRQVGGRPNAATQNLLPDLRYLFISLPFYHASRDVPLVKPDDLTAAMDDVERLRLLENLPNVDLLPPRSLPDKWIDYTCFDLMFVSLSDLRTLAAEHPRRWRAIRDWVHSGPTLCVYDVDLTAARLREIESLLQIPPLADATNSRRGWLRPDLKRARTTVQQSFQGYRGTGYYPRGSMPGMAVPAGVEMPQPSPTKPTAPPPTSDPFLLRPVGLGRIVALRSAEPLGRDQYGLDWLLNEIGTNNWMWYQRHGVSLNRENSYWWDFMIPGVGRAPVGSYLVLITVFGIAIGPVSYFLLRRKRRLYLLLVTVPLGAGVVALALLGYALLTDGLGVRVRVRSFTCIDQRIGQAVSWSRQSYYAGIAPSQGLTFPADTACYPIQQFPGGRGMSHRARDVIWDERQELVSGYLGSRSMSQFLVIRSAPTNRRLAVAEPAGEQAVLSVTNRLGTELEKLLVTDALGDCYWAERVGLGKTVPATRLARDRAAAILTTAYNAHQPTFPSGYNPQYYGRAFGFGGYYWSNVDQGMAEPIFATNLLERSLTWNLESGRRRRPPRTDSDPETFDSSADSETARWPLPRSYVAITRISPEVPLGYPQAREEASFHVMFGRW